MAKSNLPLKLPSQIYAPPPKSPILIYPPQIAKSNLPLKWPSPIYPQMAKSDLPLKLPSPIYLPPPKSPRPIYPHPWNCQVWFTPHITSTFFPLQHHALLHKGLFCERPMSVEGDGVVTNSARTAEMNITNCCDL